MRQKGREALQHSPLEMVLAHQVRKQVSVDTSPFQGLNYPNTSALRAEVDSSAQDSQPISHVSEIKLNKMWSLNTV